MAQVLKLANKVKDELTFGEAMCGLRLQKHVSARALSLAAGLSPSYVGKIETGTIKPSLEAFVRIVEVLECSDIEILFLLGLI